MRKFLALVTAILFLSITTSPSAQAADITPPLLVDWTLQDTRVDISKSDVTATVKFILSDESNIAAPNLLLKSLDTTQMTSFASIKEITRSGKLVSYEATVIVKFGQAPKNWQWVLYPLKDSLGNASTSFGPDSRWPNTVVVTDGVFTAKLQSDIEKCQRAVRTWNIVQTRFFALEKKYPDDTELGVVKIKFSLSSNLLDEKVCDSSGVQGVIDLYGSNEATDRINRILESLDAFQVNQLQADILKQKEKIAELQNKKPPVKKTSISCTKGKLTKKVTSVSPKCPTGYMKK